MRRFLTITFGITLTLGIALLATGGVLAKSGPFLPGDWLFSLQHISEQQQARWAGDPNRQVDVHLDLAERRLTNLVSRIGSEHELLALSYLNEAIDQAIQTMAELPPDSLTPFKARLFQVVKKTEAALTLLAVTPQQNPDQVIAFSAKLATLKELIGDPQTPMADLLTVVDRDLSDQLVEAAQEFAARGDSSQLSNPLAVPFPADSPASQHEFFPLLGQHAAIACEDCHANGVYDNTPTSCESCHGGEQPENHFNGDCAACHSSSSWSDVLFDHTLAENADCASCHLQDRPANHYSGQCSQCHNTSDWDNVSFNHSGQADCASCHADDRPANHDSGQCSQCHNTNDWDDASFNHTGQTDCASCHANQAPNNHYSGQCLQCHNTNDWDDASFNHTGQTDCKSCHENDRPAEHDPGQCSDCHNTRDWDDADDDDDDDDNDNNEALASVDFAPGAFQAATLSLDCSACHGAGQEVLALDERPLQAPLWQSLFNLLRLAIPLQKASG